MQWRETNITGAFLVEPTRVADERGLFARTYDRRDFLDRGLDAELSQCSTSFNTHRGTLRGMHYQASPHAETKLVRCTRGAVYDVIVDLRVDSPTHRRWQGFELTDENRLQVYIPKGVAHGYLTLADKSEVFYQISAPYAADAVRGVRWNDAAFAIDWPHEPSIISDRDRNFGDYHAAA